METIIVTLKDGEKELILNTIADANEYTDLIEDIDNQDMLIDIPNPISKTDFGLEVLSGIIAKYVKQCSISNNDRENKIKIDKFKATLPVNEALLHTIVSE